MSEIVAAKPEIELRTSYPANQELNQYITTTPCGKRTVRLFADFMYEIDGAM